MEIPFHIDILDIMLKGILIGIMVSAPMGPVGVLCVQRTLNKGRWYGFATGVGAAISDIFYAIIVGCGMSFVMNLITNPHTIFALQIVGSLLLLVFGLYCFRSNPTRNMHISGKRKGSLLHNGVTAFLVTVSNPLIMFIFLAAFAQFAFIIPGRPIEMLIGYLCILGGALLWWFGLTWLVDKIKEKFDTGGILLINRVIGCIVVILSVVILLGTVFNLYKIHY